MRVVASLLLIVLSGACMAQWSDEALSGRYVITTGFEVWALDLKSDHTATYSWNPDHPGGMALRGSWKVDSDLLTLDVAGTYRKKPVHHVWKFVPVLWGDRRYLILEQEIWDFAGMALRWFDDHHDRSSQDEEAHRGPLLRLNPGGAVPRRTGKPKAPGRFADLFRW